MAVEHLTKTTLDQLRADDSCYLLQETASGSIITLIEGQEHGFRALAAALINSYDPSFTVIPRRIIGPDYDCVEIVRHGSRPDSNS